MTSLGRSQALPSRQTGQSDAARPRLLVSENRMPGSSQQQARMFSCNSGLPHDRNSLVAGSKAVSYSLEK